MSPNPPKNESELIELIRAIDVRAPDELHRRTSELIAQRSGARLRGPSRARSRTGLRLGGALGAAVAVAIVLALTLSGGGSSPLSVKTAAALTVRAATMAAPGEDLHERAKLTAAVDGVAFPYWEERFGWRSSGSRIDRVAGRLVRTVFYTDSHGQMVGYAIVAGSSPTLSGGVVHWRRGTPYRLLHERGSHVIAWLRDGHLCVVGGRGVSDATLLRLASWDDRGTAA
ncbi:MAG: hypothetical protein ACYDHN_15145 [Solirubrobacteraceae bacterium]